jgi:copper transport protein
VGLLVAGAGPAAAHASLESTEPAASAVLSEPPERVSLRFTEAVEVAIGGVRVYEGAGERLDDGRVTRTDGGRTVTVDVPDLERGAYVVTYRVVSVDSHPIRGAFTFRVGAAATEDQALVRRLLAAEGGSTAVGAAYAGVRALVFASLLLLVGGAVFLVVLWPAGAALARVRRVLWGAWTAAVVSTVLAIGLQGAYGAGLGLGDTVRWSVISAVLETRYGRVSLARLGLLVVGAVVLRALLRRPTARPVVAAAAVMGVAVLATPGLAGHAGAARLMALVAGADTLHLLAAATWLGGAVMLAACVLPADPATVDRVVPRYARLALMAVAVLAVTGTFVGWRQSESIDAVTSTTYGRLLLLKVALFLVIVGLASLSRTWVRRRYWAPARSPGPGAVAVAAPDVGRLRRLVAGELTVAVGVLVLTSLLVNAVPARTAVEKPFSAELAVGAVLVEVTVDPAKVGPADVHVYTFDRDTGAVRGVEGLTAELRQPARGIGPLAVPLREAGPGHWSAYGFDLPVRGEWRLDVVARTSDVDQERASATFTVR